jgi:SH3 domain-containing YSC84-like protein 1
MIITRRRTVQGLLGLSLGGIAAAATGGRAGAQSPDQTELVDRAKATLERMLADREYATFKRMLPNAKAALIVPSLFRAGFVVGGEGGSGVLMSRNPQNEWSYPAFMYVAAGSVGLQIGVQEAEVVLLIMTDNGLFQVTTNEFRMGVDASVAAGPTGAGRQASTTFNFGADIYSFSRTRGLYGGVSFDGSIIRPRLEWNRTFYGRSASTRQIIIQREVANPSADQLRATLARA